MYFTQLCFILSVSTVVKSAFERKNECLPGNNHKRTPGPEEGTFGACHEYKNNSCCTAAFTQTLSASPIVKVEDTYWNRCGNLSRSCEQYKLSVECFYRCSPNAIYWKNPDHPSAALHVPVCAEDCDAWFEACKDDMTCATNWLTDWNFTKPGENHCKMPCKSFTEIYKDGKGLCEKMWGSTFLYEGNADKCIKLQWSAGDNPNNAAVEKIFASTSGGWSTVMKTAFADLILISCAVAISSFF
ncbi:riboflavin-binding protein isoform X3 [Lingula anatina]|nr:riboflavin-binding protein isoform X2 [Lingula anatina]XP_013411270.1 riboflavin-binding protein isoform X3 [Lingula anatina]|eukprot:XP_013411269.1 riboflavin-binding protein isoform X2 [Lingula anatina]